jgi:hypothetical protein
MIRLYATILVLLSTLTILSTTILAQANYAGGGGGGYGSYTISTGTMATLPDSIKGVVFDVSVYPNPLRSNDVFKAKILGAKMGEKLTLIISDIIGTRLLVEQVEVSDELIINVPYERLSKGIYLITFQYKSHKITRRFNYTN